MILVITLAILTLLVDCRLETFREEWQIPFDRGMAPGDIQRFMKAPFICDGQELSLNDVNDNYCDCPISGLDEPGTSACDQGRFFCHDKFLAAWKVDDGICDCCDGSDEPHGICPHTCEAEDQVKRDRRDLAAQGLAIQQQREQQETGSKQDLRKKLHEAEEAFKEAQRTVNETTERLAKLEKLEERWTTDGVEDLSQKVQKCNEVVKSLLDILDSLEASTGDPNARIQESLNSYHALKSSLPSHSSMEEASDPDIADLLQPASLFDSMFSVFASGSIQHEVTLRRLGGAIHSLKSQKQRLEEERDRLSSTIPTLQGEVGTEYRGLESVKGQCFKTPDTGSDEYEVCLFERAIQRQKSGHKAVVGREGSWDENGNLVMDDGDRCWSGQTRKLTLQLECGLEENLQLVREASMCVYEGILVTPAACRPEMAEEHEPRILSLFDSSTDSSPDSEKSGGNHVHQDL